MSDLLNDIYRAATEGIEMPRNWETRITKASRAYDALILQLTPEARGLYERWDLAQGDVDDLETQVVFFQGVKLGLALGLLS